MDETLIENWNRVVDPKDTVIHLGDFSFKAGNRIPEYVSRLNGKKFLLLGNHDDERTVRDAGFDGLRFGFWDFKFFDHKRGEKRKAFLCHYPMLAWNASFHGRPHLFGHVHSGPRNHPFDQRKPNSYDVGVDNNEFTPVNLVDLMNSMEAEYQRNHVPEKRNF